MPLKPWKMPLLAACAMFAASAGAWAAWPDTMIHVIVPYAAGSTPDSLARIIGERLSARLGQPVIVENKPGANGNIGTDAVAKARPDGNTIGVSIAGPLAINPLLYKHLPYDPATDFALITVAASQPGVLVVAASMGVANLAQFLAEVRTKKPYAYGSNGVGSVSHLSMATLVSKVGGNAVHVPYTSAARAVFDLLGGQLQFGVFPAGAVLPQIQAGKLRALAVTTKARSAFLPGVPTLAESGYPELVADAWIGYIAPAATPAPVIARLRREIIAILNEPEVRPRLAAQLMEPVGNTPAEFRDMMAQDAARWRPVILSNGITAE